MPAVSVAVVGGGMAGLSAANALAPTHPDVVLLEASPVLGGRVRTADGLAPWPVELGAEFVHGAKSQLNNLLTAMGCILKEYDWPDRWWFEGDNSGMVGPGAADADVDRVTALLAAVGEVQPPPPGQDVSVEAWLKDQGVSDRGLAVADACFANDFGCALADLGLTETIAENTAWDAGDTYLVPDRPFSDAVAHLAAGLPSGCVRTGWPVTRVRVLDGSGGACLTGPGGATLHARRVVVAVPLAVLQAGAISFDPPPPPAKRAALGRVRVGGAVKVVLAFGAPFWPPDFFDAVCPGAFVPEFWVNSGRTPRGVPGPPGATASLTAFLAGRRADEAGRLGEQDVVQRCLEQLDAMLGELFGIFGG